MRTLPFHSLAPALLLLAGVGCSASRNQVITKDNAAERPAVHEDVALQKPLAEAAIRPILFEEQTDTEAKSFSAELQPTANEPLQLETTPPPVKVSDHRVQGLVHTAVEQNPRLARLYQEYQAAAARSKYVDKLPDPKVGANIFGNPIETASGSQQANLSLSQSLPWLGRLDAQSQQACFEALAIRAEYSAERLRLISAVRTGWYRLYVIDRLIATTQANQKLLESLIDVANARIATGNASPGDVLLGTLELSQLEERMLTYRKQRRAIEAELNRLLGRDASLAIGSAAHLQLSRIQIPAEAIHQVALSYQPEIEAARLRTQATRWGVEVARLQRRPDVTLSANYFVTDDNRPPSPFVNVGEAPWSLGVQVSVPLWADKYDAMQNEARWKHQAAHASVSELADKYDARILELVSEARRAAETIELYKTTILPQARQTLLSDQDSYANGTVEFDRVIRDYRNVLTLEFGLHQAVGDLAIANARLHEAAGRDLEETPIPQTAALCQERR